MAAASADLATEASLSSPGLSSGRRRLEVASYEGAEYIFTVREAGEHFCEVPEQKCYIRRPNKSENAARDRIKEKWLNCYVRHIEVLVTSIFFLPIVVYYYRML